MGEGGWKRLSGKTPKLTLGDTHMRWFSLFVIAAVISGVAVAELQNVEVNGKIRIRGNAYISDNEWMDASWVEQKTRLGVKADFTDSVQAVIEVDSYDIWGEDFRSAAYLTGVDNRANSSNDVEMYQAYIKASEMYGTGLSLTVGRQELAFGNQWLFGVNDNASSGFTGLSWDAVNLGYETDAVKVNAVWAKMAENFTDFGKGDIDLYLLYGSYKGLEDITIDAYASYIRDDVPTVGKGTDLYTVGLRGAGKVGAFDFESEVAYQFGDIEDAYKRCLHHAENADFDSWGINLEGGYTLDVSWTPRIFAGFAWLEGGDNGDDRGWFRHHRNNDLGFNRLFTNVEYSAFIDDTSLQLSNAFIYSLGVSAAPTENLCLKLVGKYFEADQEAEDTGILWWHHNANSDLGWEIGLTGDYKYTEDLIFRAGYSHFFASNGIEDGNAVLLNGNAPLWSDDSHDFDYLFLETEVKF